jgi:hypothetical protein
MIVVTRSAAFAAVIVAAARLPAAPGTAAVARA